MFISEKVVKRLSMLNEQGHQVKVRGQFGRFCFKIDEHVMASLEEIELLADGVYSLEELEELYMKQRADERTPSPS
jgi:hypothetical protein